MKIINKKRFTCFLSVIFIVIIGLFIMFTPKQTVKENSSEQLNNKKIKEIKTQNVTVDKIKTENKTKPAVLASRKGAITERAKIYNIKLSSYLQTYTYRICKKYKVDYELALAVMFNESSFNPKAYNSRCGDFGIMQINKQNHNWLSKKLGITDFFDAEQNIHAGVYMLSLNNGEGYHYILMSYNMGEPRTTELYQSGVFTSKYSLKVMDTYYKLKETGGIN